MCVEPGIAVLSNNVNEQGTPDSVTFLETCSELESRLFKVCLTSLDTITNLSKHNVHQKLKVKPGGSHKPALTTKIL